MPGTAPPIARFQVDFLIHFAITSAIVETVVPTDMTFITSGCLVSQVAPVSLRMDMSPY
jgi:hypothetical protein